MTFNGSMPSNKSRKVLNRTHITAKFRAEQGSISVLVIGLFLITMALLMVMTNISALALSRKALTQQTEYLVQQGAQEISLNDYYQGQGNLFTYLAEKTVIDQKDPGVPLDCTKVKAAIYRAAGAIEHERLKDFRLSNVDCRGSVVSITTDAQAVLPYSLPFLKIDRFEIHGYAANTPERRNGFWLRGVRLW